MTAPPSTQQLLRHTGEYFAHDKSPTDRPRAKDLVKEGSSWLKSFRSKPARGVPVSSSSASTSPVSPPRQYQPWPDAVPADESTWASYNLRNISDPSISTRARAGSVASQAPGALAFPLRQLAAYDDLTGDTKDPEAAVWSEWNEEEALRQALEASRMAFEGVAMHQGSSSEAGDDDIELQQALRASVEAADVELHRQMVADQEEAELQRVMRESSQNDKGKQRMPRRRSTTAEEKDEMRRAMELSLRDHGSPDQAGPSSALEASHDTGSAVDTASAPVDPPLPPTYDMATLSSSSSSDHSSTLPDEPRGPALPTRRPPPHPQKQSNSSFPPVANAFFHDPDVVAAPGAVPGAPPQPHRAPPLPPKDTGRYVDSPGSETTIATETEGDDVPTPGTRPSGDSYFRPLAGTTARQGDSLSPPMATERQTSSSSAGSGRTMQQNDFPDEEEERFISGFGNVPFDPTGDHLPYGGYRTRSPAQLSRLTERTENPGTPGVEERQRSEYPLTPDLDERQPVLESAETSTTTHTSLPVSRPDMSSQPTNASSVYVDAESTASDPGITADAARQTPAAESPFGEQLKFGYECDDEVDPSNFLPGTTESVQLSAEVGEDSYRRPRGAFSVEAPTWSTLLRGLMWYGNTRMEASTQDQTRAEVGLAATFVGATRQRAAFVRLTTRILASSHEAAEVAEHPSSSPGRLRLPLPDRVLLPSSFAEIAVSLYTLRHLSSIACSTLPGKEQTTSYKGLRQLGHAIERLASEHGEGKKPPADEGKILRRLRLRLQRGSSTTAKGKEVVR